MATIELTDQSLDAQELRVLGISVWIVDHPQPIHPVTGRPVDVLIDANAGLGPDTFEINVKRGLRGEDFKNAIFDAIGVMVRHAIDASGITAPAEKRQHRGKRRTTEKKVSARA